MAIIQNVRGKGAPGRPKPKGAASPRWKGRIQRECLHCGKTFLAPPWLVERGRGDKYCSLSCAAKATSSEAQKKRQQTMLNKRPIICCLNCGKEFRAQRCRKRIFCSRHCASRWRQIKLWQQPDYRERTTQLILRGMHKKPNAPEKKVMDILNRHFPGEWKYTGDGSLVIGGYNPDFANANGKKQLIECFGTYWHSPKANADWHHSELGRIMAYNSLGFRCLVLWEHDINSKSEEELVNEIRAFTRRK